MGSKREYISLAKREEAEEKSAERVSGSCVPMPPLALEVAGVLAKRYFDPHSYMEKRKLNALTRVFGVELANEREYEVFHHNLVKNLMSAMKSQIKTQELMAEAREARRKHDEKYKQ